MLFFIFFLEVTVTSPRFEKHNNKPKKISFIEVHNNKSLEKIVYNKSLDNSHEFYSNPCIIFGDEDEVLINKWISVVNYFISK